MSDLNDTSADAWVDEAIDLRDRGKEAEAMDVLREIVEKHPDSSLARLVLGGLYNDYEKYDYATECFVEAVRICPDHELSSLALFHALNKLGNTGAAIIEMARFLSISESEEYRRMHPEIKRKWRDENEGGS